MGHRKEWRAAVVGLVALVVVAVVVVMVMAVAVGVGVEVVDVEVVGEGWAVGMGCTVEWCS